MTGTENDGKMQKNGQDRQQWLGCKRVGSTEKDGQDRKLWLVYRKTAGQDENDG